MESRTRVTIRQVTCVKINQNYIKSCITVTIGKPKKYLQYINDLQPDDVDTQLIVTNNQVMPQTMTCYYLWLFQYIYMYNILSHISTSGDVTYASLIAIAETILLGEVVTLLFKL